MYTATVAKYKVFKGDQYNINKKGIAMGVSNRVKILVSQLEAKVFITKLGNCKWVSLIKYILEN